ncbi:hypothetical protein D3C86_1379410 [compost metagenome]
MDTFLIILLYSKSTPALLATLLLFALTLDVLEVVVDLEVTVVATTALGSGLVPMAMILSLVTIRMDASSPSW